MNALIEIVALCLVPYLIIVGFRDRSRVRIRYRVPLRYRWGCVHWILLAVAVVVVVVGLLW